MSSCFPPTDVLHISSLMPQTRGNIPLVASRLQWTLGLLQNQSIYVHSSDSTGAASGAEPHRTTLASAIAMHGHAGGRGTGRGEGSRVGQGRRLR